MTFYPDRLTWARKRLGFSQTALAAAVKLDSRSIRAFEHGEYAPATETLSQIALTLRVPTSYFSKGSLQGPDASQVSFRSLSKMTAAKRDMALARGAFAFEFSGWLEQTFSLPEVDIPDLRTFGDPEAAAMALRAHWGLGSKPLGNLVHLLEAKGVRVFSLSIDAREVDAFSTWHDGTPYVFLNTLKTAAHGRFDAAHELAHLVLHKHGDFDGRNSEQEADRFASAFLMPRDDLLASGPRLHTIDNLVKAKKRWGVSLPALAVRMHSVGMISDWNYRGLFVGMSRQGLRTTERDDEIREQSMVLAYCLNELRRDGTGFDAIAQLVGLPRDGIIELLFNLAPVPLEGAGGGKVGPTRRDLRLVIDNDT